MDSFHLDHYSFDTSLFATGCVTNHNCPNLCIIPLVILGWLHLCCTFDTIRITRILRPSLIYNNLFACEIEKHCLVSRFCICLYFTKKRTTGQPNIKFY